jgi:hypothetical protein
VEEYNKKLNSLTEHHDIPKVLIYFLSNTHRLDPVNLYILFINTLIFSCFLFASSIVLADIFPKVFFFLVLLPSVLLLNLPIFDLNASEMKTTIQDPV